MVGANCGVEGLRIVFLEGGTVVGVRDAETINFFGLDNETGKAGVGNCGRAFNVRSKHENSRGDVEARVKLDWLVRFGGAGVASDFLHEVKKTLGTGDFVTGFEFCVVVGVVGSGEEANCRGVGRGG